MTRPPTGATGPPAGAFDVRNIIGALLTIYGVILLLVGLFGDADAATTGGVNANLWAGLALLVVGLVSSPGRGSGRSSSPTTSRPTTTTRAGPPGTSQGTVFAA